MFLCMLYKLTSAFNINKSNSMIYSKENQVVYICVKFIPLHMFSYDIIFGSNTKLHTFGVHA